MKPPEEAKTAFQAGDERGAVAELRRAQAGHPSDSPQWAYLERVIGVVYIHTLREVEGTFALERADPVLERAKWDKPGLDVLED